jgi:hypothetical protein
VRVIRVTQAPYAAHVITCRDAHVITLHDAHVITLHRHLTLVLVKDKGDRRWGREEWRGAEEWVGGSACVCVCGGCKPGRDEPIVDGRPVPPALPPPAAHPHGPGPAARRRRRGAAGRVQVRVVPEGDVEGRQIRTACRVLEGGEGRGQSE